ncbi:MAG: LytTR family DNA-binding domain-containing protein [Bacteroidota bacterium]|nr:LytTR family DNA-binding domain-containing protein [Bacteroidota bacterium]
MKVLVIDNELSIRESLVSAIRVFCPQIEDIEEADGVESGKEKILSYQPDLVFLDVELGNGTGMDLLSQLQKITFNVIFITAHNKYAIDAFKFSAIDFLLKPIDPEELIRSVNRAEKKNNNDNLLKQLTILKSEYTNTSLLDKKIVLSEQDSIHIIKSSDIIYCSSEGNYTTFYTNSREAKIVISKNMKVFEEMLSPLGFIRVHNSYLVNINKIEKYDKGDGGFLYVNGGTKIPVSQRKKELLMTLFKRM